MGWVLAEFTPSAKGMIGQTCTPLSRTASKKAAMVLAMYLVASLAPGALARTLQQTPANRTTVDGDPCEIPFQLFNRTYYDCAPLSGNAVCQVSGGNLATCSPVEGATNDTVHEAFEGPEGGGQQQQGSSQEAIQARDGQTCRLPLMYNGAAVDNCVEIQGRPFCWGMEMGLWTACSPVNTLYLPTPSNTSEGLTAATSALLVVPVLERNTTDGERCLLPTVNQGEISDDCVLRGGVPSCVTVDGVWKPCDIEPSERATWVPGDQGVDVADRVTVEGAACLLPAVNRGYLYFDCVDVWVSTAEGVMKTEACPIANGTWDICAPVDSLNPTRPFSAAYALNRTGRGDIGQLCALTPDPQHPEHDCVRNDTPCIPLPDLGGNVSQALHGLGFCKVSPVGGVFGVYEMIAAEGLPTPLAHFPLTGGDLSSVTLPYYEGRLYAARDTTPELKEDEKFTSVLHCNRTELNGIRLENVPYGVDGDFAVNLWMRRWPGSNFSGNGMQYLFSHGGTQAASTVSPNSVQLYVPSSGHNGSGLVRAIVMDATDVLRSVDEPTYLDSDGQVNGKGDADSAPTRADVNDGKWHMITLSTMADDAKGYTLYIDGQLVASLSVNTTQDLGLNVTGGDAANMDDYITLCARSDQDRERFFDGSIAHLMLFNAALTPDQVFLLYQQYNSSQAEAPQQAVTPEDNLQSGGEGASRLQPNEGSEDPSESTSDISPGNISSQPEGSVGTESTNPNVTPQPIAQSGTPNDGNDGSSGSGLSGGAIAGIALGCVCAALLAGGAAFVMTRKRGKAVRRFESFEDEPEGFVDAIHGPPTQMPAEVQMYQASPPPSIIHAPPHRSPSLPPRPPLPPIPLTPGTLRLPPAKYGPVRRLLNSVPRNSVGHRSATQ